MKLNLSLSVEILLVNCAYLHCSFKRDDGFPGAKGSHDYLVVLLLSRKLRVIKLSNVLTELDSLPISDFSNFFGGLDIKTSLPFVRLSLKNLF